MKVKRTPSVKRLARKLHKEVDRLHDVHLEGNMAKSSCIDCNRYWGAKKMLECILENTDIEVED